MAAQEAELLNLIMDPCSGRLTHGFGASTRGIVSRFTGFITPGSSSQTGGYLVVDPSSFGTSGVRWAAAADSAAVPAALNTAQLPGGAFLDNAADWCTSVAACAEVMYAGAALNRSGIIACGQAPANAIDDLITGLPAADVLFGMAQSTAPVQSKTLEVKWSPGLSSFNGVNATAETARVSDNNSFFVAFSGVKMSDIRVKITVVIEYAPKSGNGMPYVTVGTAIRPGAGERIVTALSNAGTWWNNFNHMVGMAAHSAARYGPAIVGALGYGNVATGTANLLALTM